MSINTVYKQTLCNEIFQNDSLNNLNEFNYTYVFKDNFDKLHTDIQHRDIFHIFDT